MNSLAKVWILWTQAYCFALAIISMAIFACYYIRNYLKSIALCMIYQKMRLRRIERGALTLASAEVKFQIDTETHDPLDIGTVFLLFISIFYFFSML